MSALGQKQTFAVQNRKSALPPIADICSAQADVRFVPIADIGVVNSDLGSAIVWIMSTVASRADDSDMTLIERVKI
jgi:hypothetical protein